MGQMRCLSDDEQSAKLDGIVVRVHALSTGSSTKLKSWKQRRLWSFTLEQNASRNFVDWSFSKATQTASIFSIFKQWSYDKQLCVNSSFFPV